MTKRLVLSGRRAATRWRDVLRARRLLVGKRLSAADRTALTVLDSFARAERWRRDRLNVWMAAPAAGSTLPALHASPYGDRRSVQERGQAGLACAAAARRTLQPTLTLSVVTYRSAQWLEDWFTSLAASTYPLDRLHLVFRDHSEDETSYRLTEAAVARHASRFGNCRLFRGENTGFGRGHDSIIRASSDTLVLVANADLEWRPDTIEKLVSAAHAPSEHFACWEARQSPFEHPKYYDPYTLETWWSSHACVLLDRAKYLVCGGYDRNIFMYGEDVDLSLRLRAKGFRLRYVPEAVVTHHAYPKAGAVKPLQVQGSLLASTRIKLKFASLPELLRHGARLKSLMGHADPLLSTAARASWHLLLAQGWRWPVWWSSRPRLPFAEFDFEMARAGSFYVAPADIMQRPVAERPLVSMIVRTHGDRSRLAMGAVASILRQTYRPIEILVCEDGGQQTGSLIERLVGQVEGVHLVHIPCPRGGRSTTANAGLRAARGEFVGFLDDDDALFADHVETLVNKLMGRQGVGAAYAKAYEVLASYADGEMRDRAFRLPEYFKVGFSREALSVQNLFPIQSVLFKRELLDLCGVIDERIDLLEDWNFWCRMAVYTDFVHADKTTSLYRVPDDPAEQARRQAALHAAYEPVRRSNAAFHRRAIVREPEEWAA